jgi:FkbM family methyltransferase
MRKIILSLAAWAARILPNSFKQALYKNKRLAAFIRRGLNRAAPKGIVKVEVAGGDLAGYSILLDMQIDKDYWLGTYEPELQAALRDFVPAGGIIYDVGANIGYVSLLLAKAAGKTGHIYAFEALPENAERWRSNIELNNLTDRMTLFAGAVTRTAGPVAFLVHASGGMGKVAGSAGRQEHYQAEVTVEGISLDEFVYGRGNPAPQVIKMDIEGGEVLALPGMERVLKEARPLMLMELHGPESSQAAWETLNRAGYQVCWMKPGYPVVPSLEAMGWKAYIVASPTAAK